MFIGKIVSSNSHIDYVCQVYGPAEAAATPQPRDYAFGSFVAVEREEGGYLVGVIYNTVLLNPDYGSMGPRLSTQDQLIAFSPDYLAEKATLVTIALLGAVSAQGEAAQGAPLVAANLDARVRTLERDEIAAFHRAGGRLRLAYWPILMGMNHPLALPLMRQVIAALTDLFPDEAQRLAVLGGNLAWRERVQPAG